MKNSRWDALALLLFALLSIMIPPVISESSVPSSDLFSIVWMTDTQVLSQSSPSSFDSICDWIAGTSDSLNTQAIIHTGDIINDRWNPTNCLTQFNRANHSLSILLDKNIPYCWNAGNHDKDLDQYTWNGQNFTVFNTSVLRTKPYWIDDFNYGMNTAINFNVSGWNFLVIDIELWANDTILQWVNSVLDKHNNSQAIIGTHAYIDGNCSYDKWATHFRTVVLDNHPNIFLTLNGHWMTDNRANRTSVNNRNELYFNFQETTLPGDSTIRILTFDISHGAIIVQTYNPITKQILNNTDNKFILSIPFLKNQTEPIYPLAIPDLQAITPETFTSSINNQKPPLPQTQEETDRNPATNTTSVSPTASESNEANSTSSSSPKQDSGSQTDPSHAQIGLWHVLAVIAALALLTLIMKKIKLVVK